MQTILLKYILKIYLRKVRKNVPEDKTLNYHKIPKPKFYKTLLRFIRKEYKNATIV